MNRVMRTKKRVAWACLGLLAGFGILGLAQPESSEVSIVPSVEFELHAGDGEPFVSGWDGLLPGSLK